MKIVCALLIVVGFVGVGLAGTQPGFVIDEWLVLGSFEFERDTDPFAVEPQAMMLAAAPGTDSTYAGRHWQVIATDTDGQLDLLGHDLEPEEIATAWMLAYVWSPAEQAVTLSVGSDDGIQVFVNGVEAYTHWALRGWDADQDRFPARLGEGWNRLLLRVANQTGGFAGSASILDADGAMAPAGLRSRAERPRPHAAATTAPFLHVVRGRAGEQLTAGPPETLLPVHVTVRNLGTRPAEQVTLYLGTRSGRHSTSRTVDVSAGAHEIALYPSAVDVAHAVAAGDVFEVRLAWNGPAGARDAPIAMTAGDVLRALTAHPPLRPDALDSVDPVGSLDSLVSHDDVVRMLENLRWGERFRPDLFAGAEDSVRSLVAAYADGDAGTFRERWGALRRQVVAAATEIRRQRITFVGNSHIDMAWLWDREETKEVVELTYDQALAFIDEFPFFLYAQSQMQTFEWTRELFPEMQRRMDAAVRAGRWLPVGGMWVEPDCNLPSGESFVRQLLYGKGWVRDRWGYDIRIGWNPDSFGYAWTLPMIFKGAGIDYFITQKIGWNDTTEFPHRLFWWEAPDGSRVLSFFPFTYVDDARPEVLADRLEQQQQQQPGLVDMLNLYGVGDHGGGPTRAMIERYVAMRDVETYPAVEHVPPLDFMQRVERKYEGEVPTWNDELYLEYHRGTYTTQGRVKLRNRRMESRLEAAEKFAALTSALDPGRPYPDRELDGAWRRTLFNQFHDILPGSGIADVYEDAHGDYDDAETLVDDVNDAALTALTSKIDTRGLKGAPVVVFNPLSWSRSDVVALSAVGLGEPADRLGVFTVDGEPLPAQVRDGYLFFMASDVPSIGYRTYLVRRSKSAPGTELEVVDGEGAITMRNAHLAATIDRATGNLVSLLSLPSGVETLTETGGNVLQLFGDEPEQWSAWNIGYTGEEWSSSAAEVAVVERGPLRSVVRVRRTIGNSTVIQDHVLEAQVPWLDIRTKADWQEEQKLLKTAFHLAADADVVTFEIPYGAIERPTRPRTEAERAKWEVSGQRWVDVTDRSGRFGVTLVDNAKYGYDVAGGRLRMTLLKAPTWPDPAADIGEHVFGYALYPHRGDWREAGSQRRGAEYNLPLVPRVLAARQRGPFPPELSLLAVDSPDVALTAFKAVREADRRPAFAVRLHETVGRSADVTVTFPFDVATAHRANLMEDLAEPLPVDGASVRLSIGAWALETVVVVPSYALRASEGGPTTTARSERGVDERRN